MNRAEKRRQQKLAKKKHRSPLSNEQSPSIEQSITRAGEYLSGGHLPEAESILQQILNGNPNQPDALQLLGVVAYQVGKFDIAADLLSKAIAAKSDYSTAHHNLGMALMSLGQLDEALASFRRALAIDPAYASALNNVGNVFMAMGRLSDAAESYRKVIVRQPDYADAHYNLGNAYRGLGRSDEAASCFRKTIAIKPDYAEAHRHLSRINKHSDHDEDMRDMERLYVDPAIGEEQKAHLAFGLGKAFEDLRQYDRAFAYFAEGNLIQRRNRSYSTEEQANGFNLLKDNFDASSISRNQGDGCDDETPIFILGMPRSGTTLVEQILSSHPHVHGAGELDSLRKIASPQFYRNKDAEFIESLTQIGDADLKPMGEAYTHAIRMHSTDKRFISDKMPDNFKLIGLIKLIIPNAKVIHCRRDPADTCLSIFKTCFTASHEYSHDLEELGQYYNLYQDMMTHWHETIPGFIYDIQYEDVIADQELQTKALLKFCGLEWDDACLEFYKSDRTVITASAEQVRQPIYKNSVHLWKSYEKELGPLLGVLKS